VIRIDLGSEGLGRARFAVGPLNVAANLLHALGRNPRAVARPWQARAGEALRGRGLGLLAVLGGGGPHGYAPDFLRPEPRTFHTSLDTALHQVATASPERIRYELTAALGGHSWDHSPAGRPPRLLLDAMQRGEDHLAQRTADQMQQFWQLVFTPHWPRLQTQLEDDITSRSTAIARAGVTHAVSRLGPNLTWRGAGLDIHLGDAHQLKIDADAVIFVPCVFSTRASFCSGEPEGTPDPRTPLICYPALAPTRTPPPLTDELIGNTRARLLAELTQPRTTTQLAQRLHLSGATISYHLQILHRAGLLDRTRNARHVLYQRNPGSTTE
jgi:DNA-binding transcriptional ArsR family regulator